MNRFFDRFQGSFPASLKQCLLVNLPVLLPGFGLWVIGGGYVHFFGTVIWTASLAALLAAACSSEGPLGDGNHLLSRSLNQGLKIRTVFSIPATFLLPISGLGLVFLPEIILGSLLWIGWDLIFSGMPIPLEWLFTLAGPEILPVCVGGLVFGALQVLVIAMFSFFTAIRFQVEDRKKFAKQARRTWRSRKAAENGGIVM